MRRAPIGLLVTVAAVVVAACSGDGDTAPTSTATPSTSTTTTVVEPDDGILRLGLLAPLSGPGADIGASMRHAAEFAVTRINENGGVGGRAVRLIVQDEGADLVTASRALDQLLASETDAIIGPASSTVALELLGNALGDGQIVCSPTAAASSLDQYPDGGSFVRTIPSDTMLAEAMARAIDQTGRRLVGIIHVDDAYGRQFATALAGDVGARTLTVIEQVAYPANDTDFADEAEQLVAAGVEVVAIVGDATLGPRALDAVLDSALDPSVPIFVNDALRGPALASTLVGRDPEQRERVIGVGHRVVTENQAFLDELRLAEPDSPAYFATNTADCINLIALAATAAGSTGADRFLAGIVNLSAGGTSCSSFADCLALLDSGRNVDYDGPSGLLQLGSNGDPTRGVFDLFGIDETGAEAVLGSLQVTI